MDQELLKMMFAGIRRVGVSAMNEMTAATALFGSYSGKGLVFVHLAQTRAAAVKVPAVFAPVNMIKRGLENGLAGGQMQACDRLFPAAASGGYERFVEIIDAIVGGGQKDLPVQVHEPFAPVFGKSDGQVLPPGIPNG